MIIKYNVPMNQPQFEQSVSSMSKTCSEFKFDIFRIISANGKVDSYVVKEFMMTVNSFLKTWEEYAIALQDEIRSTSPDTKSNIPSRVIEYQGVRPYVYDSSDYASILQFTDGIVRGAKNGDIYKIRDYEDFYRQTVRKAFKDKATDAGTMVGEVINLTRVESSQREDDLFKSNRQHNFFNNNDRYEIYKAIEKTIDYLTDDILSPDSPIYSYFDGLMRSSACSWILEYVKLTLVAYACRIYAISSWAAPYIKLGKADTGIVLTKESVDAGTDMLAPFGYLEYTFMRDLDESVLHNPINYKDYVEKVKEWAKTFSNTAIAPSLDAYNGMSLSEPMREYMSTNPIYNQLSANCLYDYFENLKYDYMGNNYQMLTDYFCDYNRPCDIEKLVRHIKDFISSRNLGVGLSTSPLQDLVEIIKNAEPTNSKGEKSETLESYEQLALNIVLAHFVFAGTIFKVIGDITKYKSEQNKWPNERFRDMASVNEIHKMIIDIYKTVGVAVLFRCRDIEMKINDIRKADMNKIFDDLSIKVPGTLKDDYNKDDNNAMAVPDTNRSMNETAMAMTIESELDQLRMYNEWVKTVPGMENDWYYSEAFTFRDVIDKIKAIIKSIGAKFMNFFDNQQFKAAVKWCQDNSKLLINSTYNGSMTVIKYQFQETKHLDTLVKSINEFDPKTFKEQANLDKYVKRLYGAETENPSNQSYYSLFQGDNNPDAKSIYMNYILCKSMTKEAPTEVLNGDGIKRNMPNWVSSVNHSMETRDSCKSYNDSLEQAMTKLQSKVLTLKPETNNNNTGNNTGNATSTPPPSGDTNNKTNAGQGSQQPAQPQQPAQAQNQSPTNAGQNNPTQNQSNEKQEIYDLAQQAVTKTQQAINDLYLPMLTMVTGMLKNEYSYIRDAWSLRVTQQSGQQPAQAQNQSPTNAGQNQ